MMHTRGDKDDHVVKKTTEKELHSGPHQDRAPARVPWSKCPPPPRLKYCLTSLHMWQDTSDLVQYVSK